jgi:hypothetical protein
MEGLELTPELLKEETNYHEQNEGDSSSKEEPF